MSEKLQELKLREVRMPDPSPETVERVWRGVQEQLGSGAPALELASGPLIAELPARVVSLKLVIGGALVLLGVVGAGVAGSRWRADVLPAEVERDVVVEDVATKEDVAIEPPPSPPLPTIPSKAEEDPPPVIEAPPAGVEVPPKAKPKPESEPKPRTLADEVALIQAITKGLKQSEWKSVLKLVAEHERDFPNGQFVEEREAAKVRAQCGNGALDAGRKAAESFLARWPSSIHRATIREGCDLL